MKKNDRIIFLLLLLFCRRHLGNQRTKFKTARRIWSLYELAWMEERAQNFKSGRSLVERRRGRERLRKRERETERRQDYFIVRPPAHNNRSEHSGNSNFHGSNDGLKLSFLVFKALKTKMDNFAMVGAFVLANNKEDLNTDGCLWYFGGISSSLKAVYSGHTSKKCTSVSGVLQNGQFISLSRAKAIYRR